MRLRACDLAGFLCGLAALIVIYACELAAFIEMGGVLGRVSFGSRHLLVVFVRNILN